MVSSDLGKEINADSSLVHVVKAVIHEPRNQSRFTDCSLISVTANGAPSQETKLTTLFTQKHQPIVLPLKSEPTQRIDEHVLELLQGVVV